MILGIGIDAVDIERFNEWQHNTKLNKVLLQSEIDYCLSVPAKTAERFAARFALKEAAFKALQPILHEQSQPFLTVCKAVEIIAAHQQPPQINIDFAQLTANTSFTDKNIVPFCSLTHTETTATALVILELA